MGYEFVIEYKPGSKNIIADPLSRVHDVEGKECCTSVMTAISKPEFIFLDGLRQENKTLPDLVDLHQKLQNHSEDTTPYSQGGGILLYKGKYFLGRESALKDQMLLEFHSSPVGGSC